MMFHVFFVFLQKILYLKTMGIVKIKDKSFKTSIPEAEILKKVQVVADRINKDYEISLGIVIIRIKSAAKINAPFNTARNTGFLPS